MNSHADRMSTQRLAELRELDAYAEIQQLRETLRRLLAHHDDGCASPVLCAAAEDARKVLA